MSPLDSITATLPDDLDARLQSATAAFWLTRRQQQARQGAAGQIDQGARAAVTGGKQMGGFEELLADLLSLNGTPASCVFRSQKLELPGYFRATKKWDLLVVHQGELLAVVELKSHIGSFGNNINNRVEEAVGSSNDLWTAYRDGAFGHGRRPWLGYLILLESNARSNAVVGAVKEPHFPVFVTLLMCSAMLNSAGAWCANGSIRRRRSSYRTPPLQPTTWCSNPAGSCLFAPLPCP